MTRRKTQRVNNVTGTVAKYFDTKGYGFVKVHDMFNRDENEVTSVFVHVTDVKDKSTLDIGWTLQFDAIRTKKGWQAQNARYLRGRRPGAANRRKPRGKRTVDDTPYNGQRPKKRKQKPTDSTGGYRWVGDKFEKRD